MSATGTKRQTLSFQDVAVEFQRQNHFPEKNICKEHDMYRTRMSRVVQPRSHSKQSGSRVRFIYKKSQLRNLRLQHQYCNYFGALAFHLRWKLFRENWQKTRASTPPVNNKCPNAQSLELIPKYVHHIERLAPMPSDLLQCKQACTNARMRAPISKDLQQF